MTLPECYSVRPRLLRQIYPWQARISTFIRCPGLRDQAEGPPLPPLSPGLGTALDTVGGLAARNMGQDYGGAPVPQPRRGEGRWKGFGGRRRLVSPTPTLAFPQNAPYPPGRGGGGGCQGSHWPHASAPYKRDLLIAQGSFQMKEKAQPHARGAISALRDEWSLCHSVKMNISLR